MKCESEFSPSQLLYPGGLCRPCAAAKTKKWRENNPEKHIIHQQKYYEKNKKEVIEKTKKWAKANPEQANAKSNKWSKKNPEKRKISCKKWQQKNPEKVNANQKKWRLANPEKAKFNQKKWRENNPGKNAERSKRWRTENPEKARISVQQSRKKRWRKDSVYRIRQRFSYMVRAVLKTNGGSKNGESCLTYFSWTPEQLKAHIESQFFLPENLDENSKVWMTWENWGVYRKNGKRTWQIDHIIPQSDLPYDSMDHPNFKIAWSLENLRPLDAKQNIIDGAKRTRHKKKDKYNV